MEDKSTLKKTVMVHDRAVTLFSIDGELWSSDLAELHEHQKERAKRIDRIIAEAKRIFPKGYLSNT